MYCVALETAKERPFTTCVPFGKQRFMSSSYNQFLKLEESIKVYVNTYRENDNHKLNEYKIARQDFLYDLGLIDLL